MSGQNDRFGKEEVQVHLFFHAVFISWRTLACCQYVVGLAV